MDKKVHEYLKDYLTAIGKRGGKRRSKAKAAAARKNGRLGGRPRKGKK